MPEGSNLEEPDLSRWPSNLFPLLPALLSTPSGTSSSVAKRKVKNPTVTGGIGEISEMFISLRKRVKRILPVALGDAKLRTDSERMDHVQSLQELVALLGWRRMLLYFWSIGVRGLR